MDTLPTAATGNAANPPVPSSASSTGRLQHHHSVPSAILSSTEAPPLPRQSSLPGRSSPPKSPNSHHHLPLSPPSQAFKIKASEEFDKNGLVAVQNAQLHDAQVLEMGLHTLVVSNPEAKGAAFGAEGMVLEPPKVQDPPVGFKPILLKDMKVGKYHRGRVLNGTFCAKPVKVRTLTTILEDDNGFATSVLIPNAVPVSCTIAQAERLFPEGARAAIKNPYLKRFADNVVGILIEDPKEIVFLYIPEQAVHSNGDNGELHKHYHQGWQKGRLDIHNGVLSSSGSAAGSGSDEDERERHAGNMKTADGLYQHHVPLAQQARVTDEQVRENGLPADEAPKVSTGGAIDLQVTETKKEAVAVGGKQVEAICSGEAAKSVETRKPLLLQTAEATKEAVSPQALAKPAEEAQQGRSKSAQVATAGHVVTTVETASPKDGDQQGSNISAQEANAGCEATKQTASPKHGDQQGSSSSVQEAKAGCAVIAAETQKPLLVQTAEVTKQTVSPKDGDQQGSCISAPGAKAGCFDVAAETQKPLRLQTHEVTKQTASPKDGDQQGSSISAQEAKAGCVVIAAETQKPLLVQTPEATKQTASPKHGDQQGSSISVQEAKAGCAVIAAETQKPLPLQTAETTRMGAPKDGEIGLLYGVGRGEEGDGVSDAVAGHEKVVAGTTDNVSKVKGSTDVGDVKAGAIPPDTVVGEIGNADLGTFGKQSSTTGPTQSCSSNLLQSFDDTVSSIPSTGSLEGCENGSMIQQNRDLAATGTKGVVEEELKRASGSNDAKIVVDQKNSCSLKDLEKQPSLEQEGSSVVLGETGHGIPGNVEGKKTLVSQGKQQQSQGCDIADDPQGEGSPRDLNQSGGKTPLTLLSIRLNSDTQLEVTANETASSWQTPLSANPASREITEEKGESSERQPAGLSSPSIIPANVTATALRIQGNRWFSQGDWKKAVTFYTWGIRQALKERRSKKVPSSGKEAGSYGKNGQIQLLEKKNIQAALSDAFLSGAGDSATRSSTVSKNKGTDAAYDDEGYGFSTSAVSPRTYNEVLLGFSNRAEAWLRLQQFEKALSDSERALELDADHLKSIFRKGRALLGLGEYVEALNCLQTAKERAPLDKDLQESFQACQIGDKQSRLGVYDLSEYFLKDRFSGAPVPLCADYVGPVEIRHMDKGKGYGLIVTRDVEAGSLVLVSNPLVFVSDSDQGTQDDGAAAVRSSDAKAVPLTSLKKLAAVLQSQLEASTRNLERLLSLSREDEVKDSTETSPRHGSPSVSLFMPYGKSYNSSYASLDQKLVFQNQLDSARISGIIHHNAFDSSTLRIQVGHGVQAEAPDGWEEMVEGEESLDHVRVEDEEQQRDEDFCGIWALSSYINHSCLPNTSWVLVGKTLFVVASKDLGAGTEITFNYFDIFQPVAERRKSSSTRWAFACTCARCSLEDRLDTQLQSVKKLHALHTGSSDSNVAVELEQLLHTSLQSLSAQEKNWLRASFFRTGYMRQAAEQPYLPQCVQALESVCPGSLDTLRISIIAREAAKHNGGKKSARYRLANNATLRICRCTYGKQKVNVLHALVKECGDSLARHYYNIS